MSRNMLTDIDRGQRFGFLTTVEMLSGGPMGRRWLCKCDCGGQCIRYSADLRRTRDRGYLTTCSRTCAAAKEAWSKRVLPRPNVVDLTGQTFGVLTVLGKQDVHRGRTRWLCKCACGRERVIVQSEFKKRDTSKCNCLRSVPKTGARKRPEYPPWQNSKNRCLNPRSPDYKNYGGRGIRFHEPWLNFESFLRDVGPRPGPGFSLDRIDPQGHYEPGNVRWADRRTQNNNKRLSAPRVAEVFAEALEKFGESDVLAFLRRRLMSS